MPEDEELEVPLLADAPGMGSGAETTDPQFEPPLIAEPIETKAAPRSIAPIWHTALMVIAILAYSVWGAISAKNGDHNPMTPVDSATHAVAHGTDHTRLIRYALTGLLELAVVGWVVIGLRLRKVSFRSLFGALPRGLNDITKEAGIAALFWICSMTVLVTLAVGWGLVQKQIYKHQSDAQSSASPSPNSPQQKIKSPEEQQAELAKQLMELAPANGFEIACWAFLCLIVGFSEELIFRGYLQMQSIALLRNLPIGVVFTAVVFGAAHGYQGVRGVVLITVYGALFGIIALLRKNLLPGMLAHSWHDFATGMALAAIRASHLLDHLPASHG